MFSFRLRILYVILISCIQLKAGNSSNKTRRERDGPKRIKILYHCEIGASCYGTKHCPVVGASTYSYYASERTERNGVSLLVFSTGP